MIVMKLIWKTTSGNCDLRNKCKQQMGPNEAMFCG